MDPQHQESIENFCVITGSWDIDAAVLYLSNHNWDVSAASSEFLGVQNPPPPPPVRNFVPEPEVNPPTRGILSRIYSWIGSFIPTYSPSASNQTNNPFILYIRSLNTAYYPKPTALSLENALKFAADRNKLVLIYVHHQDAGDFFVSNILCSRESSVLINEYFIFWGCMAETEEGAETIARFSNQNTVYFTVLDSQTGETIDILERIPGKTELMQFFYRFVPAQSRNSEIQAIQDRIIREQQEKEFKEAERAVRNKAEEQRLKNDRENKEREEAEYLKKKSEEQALEKMRRIGEEPNPGPDIAQITFRLPSGEKIERRFEYNTPIEVLHLFIETKTNSKAELFSGFPAKALTEGTLASQELVPRGMLHVRIIS